ncbi:hypothetical protein ACFWWT_39925 [Streptomyces sp. NPDC058676]|uniref:hypothetical protein n=1 Tax=unclassified Streptomyces TaxID=2593676 RepID=UPI00365EDF7E
MIQSRPVRPALSQARRAASKATERWVVGAGGVDGVQECGVESEQASDVAADGAQGLAGQLSAPLPSFVGEQAFSFCLLLGEAGLGHCHVG